MRTLRRLIRTAASLVTSQAITLTEMLQRPVTVRYPEEKAPPLLGARDIPTLKVNEESGLLNCTACGLCERACPTQAIEIVQAVDGTGRRKPWPEQYQLHYDHCMVCNLCVEVCPFDALEMAAVAELGSYGIGDLTLDKEALIELWKTSHAIRIHDGMMMPARHPQEGAASAASVRPAPGAGQG